MTAERLAEIEARANAATPGPWWPEHRGVMAEGVEIVDDCAVAGWDAYPENQAFIAAARTDVPALVAEVRRLTAALAAHARHTDAAVDGVRAMLPAADAPGNHIEVDIPASGSPIMRALAATPQRCTCGKVPVARPTKVKP